MEELEKLIEDTDLRRVWPDEAHDFTPWLAEDGNMAVLSDTLDLDITVQETESTVGNFRVDILGIDTDTNRTVIIENQLEGTDHEHLGKIITYAAGKSASVVIWITKHAQEEHRAAIEWLNSHTDSSIGFFLLEIKLYRIGNSPAAAKFEIIEKPNDWTKVQRIEGLNQQFRYDYWTAFNDYAFKDVIFAKQFRRRKPREYWMHLSIGSSSCVLTLSIMQAKKQAISVGFYIRHDKELFDRLEAQKDQIEQEINALLEWRRNPDKKSSRIITERSAVISDRDSWESQFQWFMDTALTFKRVFMSRL